MYIVFHSNFAAYIVCWSYERCEFFGLVWTDYWGNKSYYVITSPANTHTGMVSLWCGSWRFFFFFFFFPQVRSLWKLFWQYTVMIFLWCVFWCERSGHIAVQNTSDNTHTGMVSLWYEPWCVSPDHIAVKNISDNIHNGMVSLRCESSCVF